MLSLKPSFKKTNDVFVLLHYLYFPSTFSEGITTNEIPTQYQRHQSNTNKTYTFTLLPETTRTTNSQWPQSFLSSNSKHDFCYTMANIFSSHIQQCLNLTMHFSLRHLAAKMLPQLYHNFISFPYFFPSYETCSINVTPLFHAAIKNLHIKPNGIFVFLLLHSPLFSNNN